MRRVSRTLHQVTDFVNKNNAITIRADERAHRSGRTILRRDQHETVPASDPPPHEITGVVMAADNGVVLNPDCDDLSATISPTRRLIQNGF